jgi:hypothetical protein
MPGPEGIMGALLAAAEPARSPFLPEAGEALAPAGQDLVRIALVPDIPDDLVVRRLEDAVEGYRQLNDAQARGEVPPGTRDGLDDERANLGAELIQLRFVQAAQVLRAMDGLENRHFAHPAPRQ